MVDLTSRDWNNIIDMVNDDISREEAIKSLTKEQLDIFDSMAEELKGMREKNPNACFDMVENEW